MTHIGQKIEDILRERRISVVEFALQINTNRNNVYSIFRRKSIDTELLKKIGEVLDYDFFEFLSLTHLNNEKNILNPAEEFTHNHPSPEKLTHLEEKCKLLEAENALLKQRVLDKEEIISLLKKN